MPVATGLELPSEELWSDHWVAAVSVDDADLIEPLSLEQYLQRPHLVYSTGLQDISSLADRAIYASNPEARIAVSTHSFVLIPMLLGHSRLVALVNERLASQFASFAGIKLLEVLFDMPDISEAMYWHPRFTTDPAHRWLRSLLKKCAESNLPPKSKTGASDSTDPGTNVSKKARSNGP
jgi:DNA-binding transcriptional LysR family regulator